MSFHHRFPPLQPPALAVSNGMGVYNGSFWFPKPKVFDEAQLEHDEQMFLDKVCRVCVCDHGLLMTVSNTCFFKSWREMMHTVGCNPQ